MLALPIMADGDEPTAVEMVAPRSRRRSIAAGLPGRKRDAARAVISKGKAPGVTFSHRVLCEIFPSKGI